MGAAVVLGGGAEARAQVSDGTVEAPDAADIFDSAWELGQRAEDLMRFSTEARGRIVEGWSETAEVSLLADALYDLAKVQAEHAHAALTALFEQGDLTLALDQLAMAHYFSQQAEAAVAAVSVAAGMPPAVPGGAEVNTTLPVPDGKYEGWIIPEEALADAAVVKVDPLSVEGDALEAWRNAIDTNAKWLGERVFVEDLWVKDPIVVSELLEVGPRWLGEGGDIYKGQTLHLQNVWVLKTKDVYEAVKQPELMTALTVGGWDAGATAWECPGGEVFVPALYEGEKVVCRTERVTLPAGLFAPDGNPWVDIATDCSLVPEKMGECRADDVRPTTSTPDTTVPASVGSVSLALANSLTAARFGIADLLVGDAVTISTAALLTEVNAFKRKPRVYDCLELAAREGVVAIVGPSEAPVSNPLAADWWYIPDLGQWHGFAGCGEGGGIVIPVAALIVVADDEPNETCMSISCAGQKPDPGCSCGCSKWEDECPGLYENTCSECEGVSACIESAIAQWGPSTLWTCPGPMSEVKIGEVFACPL